MIPKRAFFFKSLIAITLILSISGCNKTSLDDVNQDGHIGAKTTVSSPNEDGTLRANIPNLFFSYRGDKEGMLNQSSGYLAKTDLLSGVTNFNFHTYGTVPRPYFHKYMPATKELWGIRYGIHLGLV